MGQTLKPKQRSRIRLIAGILAYRLLRHIQWRLPTKRFAYLKVDPRTFEFCVARHQTPLFRQLSSMQMWLQYNKVINLKLAATAMDGIVIRTGETISFWRLLGKPTKAKGYVEGMVLHNGTVKPGIGGGLCQLSNLLYWMTLHTPLTIAERWRHSYDVFPDSNRNQPFGSGATVAYNHIDFQVRNETSDDFVLHVRVTDDHLIGEWRARKPALHSYKIYEADHLITLEPWGGYTRRNKLFRKVYDKQGSLISDELIAENKAIMMYQPFLTGGDISIAKSELD